MWKSLRAMQRKNRVKIHKLVNVFEIDVERPYLRSCVLYGCNQPQGYRNAYLRNSSKLNIIYQKIGSNRS